MTILRNRRKAMAADTEAEAAAHAEVGEYFITDPDARNFGNIRVQPGQKTVQMTMAQAKFFLGNGLSTIDPDQVAKDRAAQAEKDAAAQAEADAKAAAAAAAQKAKADAAAQDEADKAKRTAAADTKPADGGGASSGTETSASTSTAGKTHQKTSR